ncbi:DUF932 domain-containing protein [Chitinophaga sp. NPDC101104]|uniref:DUF932 domain-containing protein n=1 Tax=Chitinophaga sp. NPDC101104 TaxID=3390561 RepID=UPI003D014A28
MHNLNLNKATNEFSFYSRREKAWHLLGQVGEAKNSREVIVQSHLDFTVGKYPNYHFIAGRKFEKSTESFFTMREDTNEVLGSRVGAIYQPLQNEDAFTFMDQLAGEENITYETAGALGKGEKIFISAKLPKHIRIGANDDLEEYIFIYNSHDGSGSIVIAYTPVRIVCNNTLNAALKDCTNRITIRHTASAEQKLVQARHFLGICETYGQQLGDTLRRWTTVNITDKQVRRLIEMAMAPSDTMLKHVIKGEAKEFSTQFVNKVDDAMQYRFKNDSQQLATAQGTLFGAYNTVTGYFQNVKKFKSAEQQFTSIMEGKGNEIAQTAFNLCAEFEREGADALFLS